MILWLASYPRSGNTFFRACLQRMYGLPSVPIARVPRLQSALRHERWRKVPQNLSQCRVPQIWDERTKPLPAHLKDRLPGLFDVPAAIEAAPAQLVKSQGLFALKTHHLPSSDGFPAIYLFRDGRDSLVSFARYVSDPPRLHSKAAERPPDPRTIPEIIRSLLEEGHPSYGRWCDNVDQWTCRPGTVCVRFEDLIRDPQRVVSEALESVGVRLPPTRLAPPSFEELKIVNYKFFRRGQVGSWIDEFPPDLLPIFERICGATQLRMGYSISTVAA